MGETRILQSGGGGAKDRTAHAMVAVSGLQPGDTVVESSSGNLGIALAREAVLGDWLVARRARVARFWMASRSLHLEV